MEPGIPIGLKICNWLCFGKDVMLEDVNDEEDDAVTVVVALPSDFHMEDGLLVTDILDDGCCGGADDENC